MTFEEFLKQNGAEVLPVTNNWEVLRFRCDRGTGIVYQNKKGKRTYVGAADELWKLYNHQPSDAFAPDRVQRRRSPRTVSYLFERDGEYCFYCSEVLTEETATIEHLLSVAHGGTNHKANLCLACQPCNQEADSMTITQKVALRESKRK